MTVASCVLSLLAVLPGQSPWRVSLSAADWAVAESSGSVLDRRGATLAIRSSKETPGAVNVGVRLVDSSLAAAHVRFEGLLRGERVKMGFLTLNAFDAQGRMVGLGSTSSNPLRGTSGPMWQTVTVSLPRRTARVVVGVAAVGAGTLRVDSLRVIREPLPSPGTPMAPQAAAMLDTALVLMQTRALRRDSVNWSVVEPEVRELAAGARSPAEVHDAIRFALLQLGDSHSRLIPPQEATQIRDAAEPLGDPPASRIVGGVGIVTVPSMTGSSPEAQRVFAAKLRERIAAVRDSARCGWVIDLRTDGGGNMWPMLAGLQPFLGTAALGRFDDGRVGRTIDETDWHADQVVKIAVLRSLADLVRVPIAVLYGMATTSSGEAIAVAFRGRPRTRSFGMPTAGLSTANSMHPLPDGSVLNLTESVYVDRVGNRYGGSIQPDQVVAPDLLNDTDRALEAALNWVRSESGCRAGR